MRILVIGGAGFVGSHVVDAYLHSGFNVAIVDDFSTGRAENVPSDVPVYRTDVQDGAALQRVFDEFRPTHVNHLAAQCEVPRSLREPQLDASINVLGSINVLESCIRFGVRKLLYSSTGGAVYGNPSRIPCTEADPPRPLSPYGTSKYCVEQYLAMYGRTFGLRSTVLRYANVFGPRQGTAGQDGRVVALFAKRMLAGGDVTIDGDGEQARDLVYVEDVAAANVAALWSGDDQVYNVGTGRLTTINEIFLLLSRMTGYGRPATFGPARRGDVYRISLDASKAAAELGWKPKVSLIRGLERTVDALRVEATAPDVAGQSVPDTAL